VGVQPLTKTVPYEMILEWGVKHLLIGDSRRKQWVICFKILGWDITGSPLVISEQDCLDAVNMHLGKFCPFERRFLDYPGLLFGKSGKQVNQDNSPLFKD